MCDRCKQQHASEGTRLFLVDQITDVEVNVTENNAYKVTTTKTTYANLGFMPVTLCAQCKKSILLHLSLAWSISLLLVASLCFLFRNVAHATVVQALLIAATCALLSFIYSRLSISTFYRSTAERACKSYYDDIAEATDSLTNNELLDVVEADTLLKVGQAAMRFLTDPQIVDRIAQVETHWQLSRLSAVAAMVDTDDLGGLSPSEYIRLYNSTTRKITGTPAIGDITVSDMPRIHHMAAKKLTDQSLLAKIVLEKLGWPGTVGVALAKLTDQDVLAQIAVEATGSFLETTGSFHYDPLPSQAVEKLTDQRLLEKVAKEATSRHSRGYAVEKLTNQTFLGRIAVEDGDALVRQKAVRELTDQTLLAQIAVNDADPDVQKEAARRVTDPALLGTIPDELKDIPFSTADKLGCLACTATLLASLALGIYVGLLTGLAWAGIQVGAMAVVSVLSIGLLVERLVKKSRRHAGKNTEHDQNAEALGNRSRDIVKCCGWACMIKRRVPCCLL